MMANDDRTKKHERKLKMKTNASYINREGHLLQSTHHHEVVMIRKFDTVYLYILDEDHNMQMGIALDNFGPEADLDRFKAMLEEATQK